MCKIFSIVTAIILAANAVAQAPEEMSYQAVLRDVNNTLLTNQTVGIQFSILQTSITGPAFYVETQTANTNINGLLSTTIGSGTIISGSINSIEWMDGPYFIKTEIDPTGGSNYTITSSNQLLSVPYALFAQNALNSLSDFDTDSTNEKQTISRNGTIVTLSNGGGSFEVNELEPTYSIGLNPELGGYVFWVSSDGKHGLVVETINQGSLEWYTHNELIMNPANHSADGQRFTDWRLPTLYELDLLYPQQTVIGMGTNSEEYWSSAEYLPEQAYGVQFGPLAGWHNIQYKTSPLFIRSVRSF